MKVLVRHITNVTRAAFLFFNVILNLLRLWLEEPLLREGRLAGLEAMSSLRSTLLLNDAGLVPALLCQEVQVSFAVLQYHRRE